MGFTVYILRMRGMPMRRLARFFISSTRFFLLRRQRILGQRVRHHLGRVGSERSLGGHFHHVGVSFLAASKPFLISRMSATSSTRPFSQLLPTISRLIPCRMGILDFFQDSSELAIFTSMKVLMHLFVDADLSDTRLSGASLVGADLRSAKLEGADFSEADLSGAILKGLTLSGAQFTSTRFTGADLTRCNLEGMVLPGAVFADAELRDALLTGSHMPGADFRGARLRAAGLAEVEWEGVDLRGADLREAAFHLGSSRSGLVGSPIACEGSRTGFYTDDWSEQDFKSPEEIRKANLCGADLRVRESMTWISTWWIFAVRRPRPGADPAYPPLLARFSKPGRDRLVAFRSAFDQTANPLEPARHDLGGSCSHNRRLNSSSESGPR